MRPLPPGDAVHYRGQRGDFLVRDRARSEGADPGIPEHMHPEIALMQAGAGMDVAGRDYDRFTDDQRHTVIAAYPRGPNFKHEIIEAFYQGMKHRPSTTFGTFNDDVLAFKDHPGFQRVNLCSIILNSESAN
jgi:hypothetical protein